MAESGKITIIAKNIKGNASGQVRYDAKKISNTSGGIFTQNGKGSGISYGVAEERKALVKKKVAEEIIEITCELYMHNNQALKIPYLRGIQKFNTSKPFIAGIRSIFGSDIKHKAAKQLMLDLRDNKVKYPEWKIDKRLSDTDGGYYDKGTIYLNENLIRESEKDPEKAWILFRVMIEETGHYIDDLLRNKYDSIGGDANGDEGTMFAADFMKFNDLLLKDFHFAKFRIKSENGIEREFLGRVSQVNPSRESKAKDLLFIEDKEDDHGVVTLKSGEKINVEFFKIRGGGAIHESITKNAALKVGLIYDYRLDEGCAWPDVPCADDDSIETCYYETWRNIDKKGTLAYESHNGSKQFWHSMAPTGNHTNQQVIDLIVDQAKIWFRKAIAKNGDDGLFFMGKMLHMIQDSYSLSHVQRDAKNNIIQIQGYDAQDAHKHGEPDKNSAAKGVTDATFASMLVLIVYKNLRDMKERKDTDLEMSVKTLEILLRNDIYPLAKDRGAIKAGGSLDAYKK